MAVTQVGMTDFGDIRDFQGLSSDTKPVENVSNDVSYRIGDGSTFYELNTGRCWVYDSENVNPETSDHWWEVV